MMFYINEVVMFTGLIEETGFIKAIYCEKRTMKLVIEADIIFSDLKIGDSVSVNGVCLTVTSIHEKQFCTDVMPVTFEKSSLKMLNINDKVNLERAAKISDRLGGHIVAGHIDGTGTIISITKDENSHLIEIAATQDILKFIILHGSIAVDGISLTVASLKNKSFVVSIIPHTMKNTALLDKKTGTLVNLECDCIGKYVYRLINAETSSNKSNISKEFLEKYGF